MLGMSFPGSFLPLLAKDLDPSEALVGLVVSAWFISRIFIELPMGIISDRIGRRKLFLVGIGLSVLGAFLCAQAGTIYVLILGRSVWGLGAGLFFMNNTALVIDLFESEARGRALGLFNGIELLGSVVGAPIGAFLVGVLGYYSNVFYVTLVLVLISLILALTSKSFKAVKEKSKSDPHLSVKETLMGLQNGGILTICRYTFTHMLIMTGIFSTILPLYFSYNLFFSLEYTSLVLSARIFGNIIAALSSGFLSDRFGRKSIVAIGFTITALFLFLFIVNSSLEVFLVVAFFESFGESLAANTLIVILFDIAPLSIRGGAIGLQRTFMDAGGFVGPIAFMLIYTNFGSHIAILVGVGIKVLDIVLLVLMRKKLILKT